VSPLKRGVRFGKGRGEKATPGVVVTFGQLLQHRFPPWDVRRDKATLSTGQCFSRKQAERKQQLEISTEERKAQNAATEPVEAPSPVHPEILRPCSETLRKMRTPHSQLGTAAAPSVRTLARWPPHPGLFPPCQARVSIAPFGFPNWLGFQGVRFCVSLFLTVMRLVRGKLLAEAVRYALRRPAHQGTVPRSAASAAPQASLSQAAFVLVTINDTAHLQSPPTCRT
jgi:hypothetical protein